MLFMRLFFSRIARATTSKQAWTILQNEFHGSTKVMVVKLQALRHQFETLLMKNNETVQDFLSRVTTITSQMEAYGEQITDETIVSKRLLQPHDKREVLVITSRFRLKGRAL
ncbi:hypothetical protein V6N12_049018 [Hibiscus sabdariffa]|uniref:Uncharacterized protein n=1 Tax=Hibiscus sabdariffa TaxID=183260 RepID=A0ABR2EKH3_9ROSI